MGLDDIDEDDNVAAKQPAQKQQQQQQRPPTTATQNGGSQQPVGSGGGHVDLDELFGGIPSTTVSSRAQQQQPHSSSPIPVAQWTPQGAQSQSGAASHSGSLDAFSVAPPPLQLGTARAGMTTAPRKSNDFLDDLFSSSAGGASAGGGVGRPTPPSVSPAWQSPQSTNLATAVGLVNAKRDADLLGSETGERRQHQRTAVDFLDGFEAKAKGRAWAADKATAGPKLGEIRGSEMSYTALAANPRMQELMTYYDFLGVAPTAATDDIKRSYKDKALRLHPDKRRARGDAVTEAEEELFKTITKAHEVLADPELRAQYDAELRQKEAAARLAQGSNWLRHVGH